jgi:opacity protein-like surface antigen
MGTLSIKTALLVVAVSVAFATPVKADVLAFDDFEPYVSVFGGGGWLNDISTSAPLGSRYNLASDFGYIAGGAIGAKISDNFRVEGEFSHAKNKASSTSLVSPLGNFISNDNSGGITSNFLLANVWFDVRNDTMFTPYVGGGLGAGWASGNIYLVDVTEYGYGKGKLGLAFQVGTGVKVDVSENVALDIGYRFKSIQGIDFKSYPRNEFTFSDGDVNIHTVQVGLTYKF